jgi:DNA-binding transcriptional LysR family regulator
MLKATFRQLQTFVLVVESGSFTSAATRLGVSPAAISDQIRSLEQRIDCALFDRRPGTTPMLNKRGELLLQQATQLLDGAAKVSALAGAALQPLLSARLVADEYIVERLLRPILPNFQKSFPEIQVEFQQLNVAADAVQALRSGRADLAYVTLWTLDIDWPIDIISTVEIGLFVSPRHPIARSWKGDKTQNLPLITPIAGSGMELLMNKSLIQAGLTNFHAVAHAQYGATMAALAKDGVGACYVFREAVLDEVESGELVELEVEFAKVHRCALRRPGALELAHLRQVDDFALSLIRGEMKKARKQRPA